MVAFADSVHCSFVHSVSGCIVSGQSCYRHGMGCHGLFWSSALAAESACVVPGHVQQACQYQHLPTELSRCATHFTMRVQLSCSLQLHQQIIECCHSLNMVLLLLQQITSPDHTMTQLSSSHLPRAQLTAEGRHTGSIAVELPV